MLFSEPKIPQLTADEQTPVPRVGFSALQRAENSSIRRALVAARSRRLFQCSSASRKFLNAAPARCRRPSDDRFSALQRAENSSIRSGDGGRAGVSRVSVLFSEPKIPQSARGIRPRNPSFRFQCSSASRKFLNFRPPSAPCAEARVSVLFSEPKIPQCDNPRRRGVLHPGFQCSSASRKFLNSASRSRAAKNDIGFSALQRAENSSIVGAARVRGDRSTFQCSSASRKFLNVKTTVLYTVYTEVSVLFSEPKIPQSKHARVRQILRERFSALQRAENSSIGESDVPIVAPALFQCSSASRKFLNSTTYSMTSVTQYSFSALQRAENSSISETARRAIHTTRFQCSSASRKFLNRRRCRLCVWTARVSVLFSEPKIPQSFATPAYVDRVCYVSVLFSEPKIPQ